MSALAAFLAFGAGVAGTRWFYRVAGKPAPPPGHASKINWLSTPFPGVVFQKDGSFLAGWRFRGPDPTSVPAEEINRLARRVGELFLPNTDLWCFHVDMYRTAAVGYAPEGMFPDPVTRTIDWERRSAYEAEGEKFEAECYLTATYCPPPEMQGKFASFFQMGGVEGVQWEKEVETFRRELLEFSDRISGLLQMERLGTAELLSHLYRSLTGRKQYVLPPFHGSYLDTVLAHEPFVGDFAPTIGDQHIRLVAIHGYPDEVAPGVLKALGEMPFEYRWSSRLLPLSQAVADPIIKKRQKEFFENRKGAKSWAAEIARGKDQPVNTELDAMQEDAYAKELAKGASDAIALNSSGRVRYCQFNTYFVLHRDSAEAAEHDARQLIKAARDAGFTADLERMHAAEAFWGTLPGHGEPNVRDPLLSTENIAALLPTMGAWAGPSVHPCQYYPAGSPPLFWADASGSTPFRANLHVGDVGHTLVVGSTGGGKSTVLQLIASQAFRYPDAQVFVFDKGRAFELLCKAAGGEHFTIRPGEEGGKGFQPLARVDDPAERAWALDWIGTLLKLQGIELTPSRTEVLNHGLGILAAELPRYRTMTAFRMQVAAADRELGDALKVYTGEGPYGHILDGDEDVVSDASFQVYETHHLFDLGDEIGVPVQLFLIHRLDNRFNDNRPTFLIVDEAASSLAHPLFEEKIRRYAVTLRKHNVALILAFQDLVQFQSLESHLTLLGSCPTRIFLPDAGASSVRSSQMYRQVGLNDAEIALLVEGQPKKHYFIKSPNGSRMFELSLGPVARSFFFGKAGSGTAESVDHAESLQAVHGEEWPAIWLEEAGAHEAAAQLRRFLRGGTDGKNVDGAYAGSSSAGGRHVVGIGRAGVGDSARGSVGRI